MPSTQIPLAEIENLTELPVSTSAENGLSGRGSRFLPEASSRENDFQPAPVPAPRTPKAVSETGIPQQQIGDLLLKTLYVHGILLGNDLARLIRLPFNVIEEPLRTLRDHRLVEIGASDLAGRVSYRFSLTDSGRNKAHEVLEHCRYIGPAPVSLEHYIEHCQLQRVANLRCSPAALRAALKDLVLRPSLLNELGPAICSGKSLLLSGPPGNGKTVIAKGLGRYLSQHANEIYVPYAILIDNAVVTLFDPGVHQTTDDAEQAQRGLTPAGSGTSSQPIVDGPIDMRWRRIRRPVVVAGSELTLDMLELKYNKVANFYSAPLQIKANGGLFLIDDLGRQTVRSIDLMNRWAVPLEEGLDYLTLATGRKCVLPIEQLTVFATNLDLNQVLDEATLRRMKHKVRLEAPSRELYAVMFQMACRQSHLEYDESIVNMLFSEYYEQGRQPRASDPRDMLELARSICRFHNMPFALSLDLVEECARQLFGLTAVSAS